MLQVYGVDVLAPGLSARRLAVLVNNLPPQARRFGEPWSTEADLLALVSDQLRELTWATLRIGGAKGLPRPRPLPRPGQQRPGPSRAPAQPGPAKAASWAQAAQMIGAIPGVVVTDGR
jgi:hypothetical protein